jgi:hypothetical protein
MEALLVQLQKNEDLKVWRGARTMEFQLSAL